MRAARSSVSLILALTTLSAGCHKPYFMTELDYTYYNRISGDYDHKDYGTVENLPPGNPRTVRDPAERVQWQLSLAETKRITLENNKQIAFLGYQPGEAGTNISLQESIFDAFFETGVQWGKAETQVTNAVQVIGTGRDAIVQKTFGTSAGGFGVNSTLGAATQDTFSQLPGVDLARFSKRNVAGGLTVLSYGIDYQNINPVNAFTAVNPSWRQSVNFSVSQPVLQGAGVEYNRSQILIARSNHEQAIKQFETSVRTVLRDVEVAYWQLYFTYQDLYSREQGMRQALATWQKEKNKQEVGTGAVPDVAQAREQYEFFRGARLQALARVLAAERDLRELMGLPPDDERQIVPADDPTIAEYEPDWSVGVLEAMDLRPELAAQRYAIRSAEIELMRQKNGLMPDLTVGANYGITGLDNQFDQSVDVLTNNQFTNWTLSARYRRQIGERSANAAVRRAQLALSRLRAQLRNEEQTILTDLQEAFQNLITNYELIQIQKDRREAATAQLLAREQFYQQGKTTIDVLLQAQTTFADALRDEGQAIVNYNQSLIQWEFHKGTILINDNVALAEDGVSAMNPKYTKNRIRQWQKSLPLPIHKGDKVHADSFPCPDTSIPLYRENLGIDPATLKENRQELNTPAPEAPAEMEGVPSAPPTETPDPGPSTEPPQGSTEPAPRPLPEPPPVLDPTP